MRTGKKLLCGLTALSLAMAGAGALPTDIFTGADIAAAAEESSGYSFEYEEFYYASDYYWQKYTKEELEYSDWPGEYRNNYALCKIITAIHGSGSKLTIPNEVDGLPVLGITASAVDKFEAGPELKTLSLPANFRGLLYSEDKTFYNVTGKTFTDEDYVKDELGYPELDKTKYPDNGFTKLYELRLLCDTPGLENIEVDKSNPFYTSENGIVYSKDKTILVAFPQGRSGSFTIPDSVEFLSTSAFYNSALSDLTLSKNLKFSSHVFATLALYEPDWESWEEPETGSKVAMDWTYTKYGYLNPFAHMKNLSAITIPAGNDIYFLKDGMLCAKEYTYDYNDEHTKLEASPVTCDDYNEATDSKDQISPSVSLLKYFSTNTASSFTIPEGIHRIQPFAFEYCNSLETLNVPATVKRIEKCAFCSCENLKTLDIVGKYDYHKPQWGGYWSGTGIQEYFICDCPKLEKINFSQYAYKKEWIEETSKTYDDDGNVTGEEKYRSYTYKYGEFFWTKYVSTDGALYSYFNMTPVPKQKYNEKTGVWEDVAPTENYDYESYRLFAYAAADPKTVFFVSEKCDYIGREAFNGAKNLKYVVIDNDFEVGSGYFAKGQYNVFEDCSEDLTIVMLSNKVNKKSFEEYCNKFGLKYTYTLPADVEMHKPGDADGNGRLEESDLAILQQYIAGWKVTIDEKAADVNADGKVSEEDIALLQQYFAGWKVTLGKK